MTLLALLSVLAFLFLSAVFSGSETGIYSLSRVRLEAEARKGHPVARLLRRLSRNDAVFLITLLIGNNLMLELLTHSFQDKALPEGLPQNVREIAATLFLTPVVFLFGELFPKDAFRRRPHRFLYLMAPLLALARVLFLPLALPVYGLSLLLESLSGLRKRAVSRAIRREEMLEILEEGAETGALPREAQELARNVLVLRETPIRDVMIPWDRVRKVELAGSEEEARAGVMSAEYTRLPVVQGGAAAGYLHQLDVLGTPGGPVEEHVRPLTVLSPATPVDRALQGLRVSGQRLALVGTVEEPLGLVTLMDLVAAISRESRRRP